MYHMHDICVKNQTIVEYFVKLWTDIISSISNVYNFQTKKKYGYLGNGAFHFVAFCSTIQERVRAGREVSKHD